MTENLQPDACWIGHSDAAGTVLRADAVAGSGPGPMPSGTLILDHVHTVSERPQNLLRLSRRDPVAMIAMLRADPDGSLCLMMRRGGADSLHRVHPPPVLPGERMVVRYVWDMDRAAGVLAVSVPDRDTTRVVEIANPVALCIDDAAHLLQGTGGATRARQVTSLAIADCRLPVGPQPVLSGDGIVRTPDGPRALNDLVIGDKVIAADGAAVRLVWVGSAETVLRGGMAPYRIRAPYYGITTDLTVAGAARLRLSGVAVEYLFGQSQVSVGVADLADTTAIVGLNAPHMPPQPFSQKLYHMMTDGGATVAVSGAAFETLDGAAIAAQPALWRWSMMGYVETQGLQPQPLIACTRLRGFEAQTLRRLQAA